MTAYIGGKKQEWEKLIPSVPLTCISENEDAVSKNFPMSVFSIESRKQDSPHHSHLKATDRDTEQVKEHRWH